MAYRLLEPPARSRRFNLLEQRSRLRLLEARKDELWFDDEPLPSGPEDPEAERRDAIAGATTKDPFKLKDPMDRPVPSPRSREGGGIFSKLGEFTRRSEPQPKAEPKPRSREGGGIFSKLGEFTRSSEAGKPQAAPPRPAKEPKKAPDKSAMSGSWVGPDATQDFVNDLVSGGDPKSGIGRTLGWDKDTGTVQRFQDVLDVVGIVDPTGVADATNALGYAARGEFDQAAISAAGIVPYLGDIGKIGKFGARGAKATGKAARAERAAGKVATRKAEKAAAEKFARTAAQPAAKAAKPSRMERLKQTYEKGKSYYARAQEYKQRVDKAKASIEGRKKEREAEREAVAEKPDPRKGAGFGKEGRLLRPTELKVRMTSRGVKPQEIVRGKETGTPVPGKKITARQRELKTLSGGRPGGGGSHRGPRGARLAPVGGKCEPGYTKTSVSGAPKGTKRCNKQTSGRAH